MQGTVIGRQALVNVVFRLPNQPDFSIEFVIDTGFEGALTLPPAAVKTLGLPFFQQMSANLANDDTVKSDTHIGTIVWSGAELQGIVIAMGRRPLLGTALLERHRLGIDFVENGPVNVDEIADEAQEDV